MCFHLVKLGLEYCPNGKLLNCGEKAVTKQEISKIAMLPCFEVFLRD